MRLSLLAFTLLCGAASSAALAAAISCPDLGAAVQVGACPAEEELKYTFTGFCSDDGKAYRGETDVCSDYQLYRKLKNVALWESGDGAFNAYVSCDMPPARVRASQVKSVKLARQGKITLLVCGYGEGVSFTHRTRAECTLDAAAECAAKPAACRASCN